VEFVPVAEEFLAAQQVAPWMGLPLWLPEDPQFAGAGNISRAKALAAGCTFRPLADTVRDTLAWWAKEPRSKDEWGKKPGQPGLSDAQEKEILAAWEARAR
jgi:2'-hydroxyisoflavone reductase